MGKVLAWPYYLRVIFSLHRIAPWEKETFFGITIENMLPVSQQQQQQNIHYSSIHMIL